MNQIEIKCQGAGVANLSSLNDFQGDLKVLTEKNFKKLRQEIIDFGFSEPVSVWADPEKGNQLYLLNGHQRVRTLKKMLEEGFTCEPIPVSYVFADSFHQAKAKLLAFTSQYGTITNDGLYEFLEHSGLGVKGLEQVSFPEINLDDFKMEFYEEALQASVAIEETTSNPQLAERDSGLFDKPKEEYENAIIKQISIFFQRDRYEEILGKLERLRMEFQLSDFSEVVGKLIDDATRN